MTIASTRTHEFDVGRICRIAYRMAGLLSVYQDMTSQQAGAAIDFFELIIHSVETEGMFARTVTLESVTLVADDATYSLAASTLDVVGNATYIMPNQTTTELPVTPMSREDWQSKGVVVSGGPPTRYYADRTSSTVVVNLWPTPSTNEAGGTVRFQCHRLKADVTTTTVTPDFEVYWAEYLATRLAMHLASSSALDLMKVQDLERRAAACLAKCRGKSNSNTNQQFVVRHGRMR